jgi:hypothetical protein
LRVTRILDTQSRMGFLQRIVFSCATGKRIEAV